MESEKTLNPWWEMIQIHTSWALYEQRMRRRSDSSYDIAEANERLKRHRDQVGFYMKEHRQVVLRYGKLRKHVNPENPETSPYPAHRTKAILLEMEELLERINDLLVKIRLAREQFEETTQWAGAVGR